MRSNYRRFVRLCQRLDTQDEHEPWRALRNATRLWNWADAQLDPEPYWVILRLLCPWAFRGPTLNCLRFTY